MSAENEKRMVTRMKTHFPFGLLAVLLLAGGASAQAQWITQTNSLKPGWNAVFLHVDASFTNITDLVGLTGPIEEIWYWRPVLPTGQFVESPQTPTEAGSQWSTWTKLRGPDSALKSLFGNSAYLVRVATNVSSHEWRVKGKPVLPTYQWTLTGLNFIGFPTPPRVSPTFESFMAPAPELKQNGEVFGYQGGELGSNNPARVVALRNTVVRRDQAYWIRSGESYNEYFGPIQILRGSSSGIQFSNNLGLAQLRLRNVANVPVTVTLTQVPSEPQPLGQAPLVGDPPLLLRGPINPTNLTYLYTNLALGPQEWTLTNAGLPGSEVEVVIGLNRSRMLGTNGARYAGVLRFTDSLGLSQLDVAVSAEKESTAGLWVGEALVSQVSNYLKEYAKATNAADLTRVLNNLQLAEGANNYHYERDPATGHVLVFGGPNTNKGSYLLNGPVRTEVGTVAAPFPLRLIIHNDGTTARLLQKVYFGVDANGSNGVLATREGLLSAAHLDKAGRISAVHLPTSDANVPFPFGGKMEIDGTLVAKIELSHTEHTSNPFLHTYHPDHDNLDPFFGATPLDPGLESYGITRVTTLTFTPPDEEFKSLTQGSQDLVGRYSEVITFHGRGSQKRDYTVLGTFALRRISSIATLTQ